MGDDVGGDPVCWLDRVCPECGAFLPDGPDHGCPRCEFGTAEIGDREIGT
ncbi:hypothetical protein ACWDUM_26320 [Rhodococcus sp. NPDC003322]